MRRRAATKRQVLADPKYKSQLVTKFVNNIMLDGKKVKAQHILYDALERVVDQVKKDYDPSKAKEQSASNTQNQDSEKGGSNSAQQSADPVNVLQTVIDNIRPAVEVRARRVGGSTYQVPVEVNERRGIALAMRWLKSAAKARSEKSMSARLAGEFYDAYYNRGSAAKKREDTHRMAKANQAFAHYRW